MPEMETAVEPEGKETQEAQTERKDISFDDFLKGEGNQAEFDRRVQKAINTAVTNAQEKWKAMTDDKLSEAEKLSRMNKEEKEQYLRQKKEKELSDREDRKLPERSCRQERKRRIHFQKKVCP